MKSWELKIPRKTQSQTKFKFQITVLICFAFKNVKPFGPKEKREGKLRPIAWEMLKTSENAQKWKLFFSSTVGSAEQTDYFSFIKKEFWSSDVRWALSVNSWENLIAAFRENKKNCLSKIEKKRESDKKTAKKWRKIKARN